MSDRGHTTPTRFVLPKQKSDGRRSTPGNPVCVVRRGKLLETKTDKDDKYRGKGTTSGHPHFNCGHKNAAWVSMDQLFYGPSSLHGPDQHERAEATSTVPRKSSREKSSPNVLSRTWKLMTSTANPVVDKEHKRYERGKEAMDAKRRGRRYHIPQAAPSLSYASIAGGRLPHDEFTGGPHPSQHHAAQTGGSGNGAGAFEHQHLPGHPQRVDSHYWQQMSGSGQQPDLVSVATPHQRQLSASEHQQPDHAMGGAHLYQNSSYQHQRSGSGQQHPDRIGVPPYQRQSSGSGQQQMSSSEYQYSGDGYHPALAIQPPYSNIPPVEHTPGSSTVCPHQHTPDHQQQIQTSSWITKDMVVVLKYSSQPTSGVVKYIGYVPGFNELIAGLELDTPIKGCTDGVYQGTRYFYCPPGRGYFCRIDDLQPLADLPPTGATSGAGGVAPTDPATYDVHKLTNPLDKFPLQVDDECVVEVELFKRYIGDGRGIQGHHNSCYLDATVFGLFALSDVFDVMFLTELKEGISLPPSSSMEEIYSNEAKQILWKGIVNPLRKHGVARFESVMKLRDYLEQLGAMEGANRDEKDPEEFLNMLFKKVLHVPPFISIKWPFGVEEEYFVQLFFEIDPKQNTLPYTETLLWKMFKEQQISFTKVPTKLMLQMPQFGKEFKMYNRVIPSLTLDVVPLLDSVSLSQSLRADQLHICFLCGEPAAVSCTQCASEVFLVQADEVDLCRECSDKSHKYCQMHQPTELIAPGGDGGSQISKMELLSVICSETSHYVCFTRFEDRWLFHDSMANRLYDMYNIPHVTEVTKELQEWIYQGDPRRLMSTPSWEIPECVRRFTQDGYMCVYINPNMDMYDDAEGVAPTDAATKDAVHAQDKFSSSEHQIELLQARIEEKDSFIAKQKAKLSTQAERISEVEEKLAQEVARLQQEKKEVETSLTQKNVALSQQQQRVLQLQDQLSAMTTANQQALEEKTQEVTRLQQELALAEQQKTQEVTHLQRELALAEQQKTQDVTRLQEEVRQLQSRLEQQPKLGSDTDISFWVVSHEEVHSTGQMLGEGGWGRVVVGSFRGQEVALKQLHSAIRCPSFDRLLHREVSLMAKVRHPNLLLFIAAVLDSPSNSPIIITELLDTNLRKAYQSGQLTNNRVKLFIMRDVAAALNYLHLQADTIVHRDVSSANVLLQALPNNQWKGKLSDFGSANLVQYASTPGPGAVIYAAPEVFKGEQSSKMDVYSYGKLLCEVFTGQFPDPLDFPAMLQSMAQNWPLMHRLICCCVEQDPTQRPTMTYVVDKLNKFTK